MLTVDHISVMNLENAMRGARNPLHPSDPGVHGHHRPHVLVEGV